MKKILILSAAFLTAGTCFSQVKEGRIVFERTIQMQFQIVDDMPQLQNLIPRERKDKFELSFANNKSLWKPGEEQPEETSFGDESGGSRIVMRMPGGEDISFHNFGETKKIDQRELGGKTYIISDSIRRMNWKIAGETKTILGYKCMKATSQRTQESFRMQMTNGSSSRERIMDTLNITAWFTSEIPGAYGPDIYQGQLPGAILEVEVANSRNPNTGRTSFLATEFSPKVDVASIKEPTKGKKVTQQEFAAEREKLFKEMMDNGGNNFRIRMGN
jgi:GLPGLI family protein